MKKPPDEKKVSPVEASYWHLPEISFHKMPQKVKDYVARLIRVGWEIRFPFVL
jgi:hypothetical protein